MDFEVILVNIDALPSTFVGKEIDRVVTGVFITSEEENGAETVDR